MANTLNASTSSGLIQTADTSGIIELQNNSTTKLAVSSSGVNIAQYNPSSSLISSATATGASGNYIDFTGIPSWVKRITVMFSEVSTNGSSKYICQLGTSGGVVSSGYKTSWATYGIGGGNGTFTSGVGGPGGGASDVYNGQVVFTLLNSSTNLWVASGLFGYIGESYMTTVVGNVTLSGIATRLRVTTANGTDYFDAGTVNILYE
jgi:hypothetical protein